MPLVYKCLELEQLHWLLGKLLAWSGVRWEGAGPPLVISFSELTAQCHN